MHKVVQKSPSKSSKQPNKNSSKGRCYRCGQEGLKGEEINAAQLAKQSVQSV